MTETERLVPTCTFQDLTHPAPWSAFRKTGLLRLTEAVPLPLLKHARARGLEVLREPERIARIAHRANDETGYTPPGIEGIANGQTNRLRHFWDIRHSDPILNRRCPFSETFVNSLEDLSERIAVVAYILAFYMEEHLEGLVPGLERVIEYGTHSLRATHYPASGHLEDGIRFPSHRDRSLFTIHVGGSESGLQMRINDAWHDLVNPAGDLVVMSGAMLRFWTGGPTHPDRIPAVAHRVRYAEGDRLALSFFAEPASDVVMPNAQGKTAGAYIDELVALTRPTL